MAAEPQATPEIDDDEEGGSRARDPEILAMERIHRMLSKMDESGRSRIVAYLAARFPTPLPF